MRTNTVLTWMMTLVIVFSGISIAVADYLPGRGGGNNGRDTFNGPEMRMGGNPHGGPDQGFIGAKFLRSANLSAEQKKEATTILIPYLPEIKAVLSEISAARMNMANVVHTEGATQEATLEAFRRISVEKETMVILRFEIMSRLKDILTQEQLTAIEERSAGRQDKMSERLERKWAKYEGWVYGLSE